jgi:hypothetical protein
MVDYHQDPYFCPFQRRSTNTPTTNIDHNHCHYEHHREERGGLFGRTTISSTTDCHQHHPSSRDSPCPGSQRARCSRCGGYHGDRSRTTQTDSSDLVRALEEILDRRSRDNEVSRLLDELLLRRSSGQAETRRLLGDVLSELLGQNGQGALVQSTATATATNRETLVDLLLRISSSTSSGTGSGSVGTPQMYGVCPGHLPAGLDMMALQSAWLARSAMPPATIWAADYAIGLPRAVYAPAMDSVQPTPRWMLGTLR